MKYVGALSMDCFFAAVALRKMDYEFRSFWWKMGHGGGQVVCVLAFYSDDSSSNWSIQFFSLKFAFEKNKNKQKEAGVAHFLKNGPSHCLFFVYFFTFF